MEKVSKNFKYEEFIVSREHPELLDDIKLFTLDKYKIWLLCMYFLQPIRDIVEMPVYILSGKRSPALNEAVEGVSNSDHLFKNRSAAVDFSCDDFLFLEDAVTFVVRDFKQFFKQVIFYLDSNFVHLSLRDGNRYGEILYAVRRSRMYFHSKDEAEDYLRGRDGQ